MAKDKRKLTARQYAGALTKVAGTTFRAAPSAVIVQVVGALVSAILPIVTTYFAALTTTALADAYAGSETAGGQAIVYVIITAALGIIMTGWQSLESYITQLMRYKVEAAMTDRMYEHFLELDFWRYDDKTTADTYEKARRFAQFFPYIFDRLTSIMTQFFTMIAGLVALTIVSWWLGAIALAAIVPGIVIQFRLSRANTKHWNSNVETRRTINMIEWNMFEPHYIAELRLYGMVRYLLNLRMKLRDKDEKQRIEFERSYIGKKLFADVLEAGAEVIALIWVTVQIINRTQPIGQFIYVQQIVSRAIGGAGSFVSSLSSIDEDIANLFDYQEFMDFPRGIRGERRIQSVPHNIVLQHISFTYPTSKSEVLHDISMTITTGQHIAIVGENGAGKSTLIKLLTGLYRPTKGAVLLDGVALDEHDISSWHRLIGILQQDFISYSFASARDNVYFGDTSRPYSEKRFHEALDAAEAQSFLEKLPKGFDSYVNQWMEDDEGNNGTDLSGGQWQRLALARNFYRQSPIIILDEPTSAIDALAEARIFDHLFKSDKTIITISHRLTTIEKADLIYMLKDGKLVEQGNYKQLVEQNGEFVRMFKSQLRKAK